LAREEVLGSTCHPREGWSLDDYPWGQIPADDWVANVACIPLLLFASNLVHGFQRLCLPRGYLFATLDTIRTDFLVLPAKPVKSGSQNLPALPQGYHHEAEFKTALRKIDKLPLPASLLPRPSSTVCSIFKVVAPNCHTFEHY